MFGSMRTGANAYANVGLETGIAAASSHKLIVMLYDGALVALLAAKTNIAARNIAAKGSAISKAIAIIDNGLRASLDKESGGEIAANLDALYEYMSRRLLHANLESDVPAIDEVHRLLSDLREAWVSIDDKVNQSAALAATPSSTLKAATLVSA
ncbi:flagellar biosynthesis protein FliS [Massilia sp. WF1]|uniref:flagellar export chaperone FliS n=1 Tax=unclassified Massilia TaxID=2609279 RepID=UPI00064AFE52|nr:MULTISPECIES: flagellar export chaperone FliS [unclassified Massilia]ALK98510.1 flagellar protein FliS [Massilia sp. WG5]KLU37576.1 flagellar biosynthesis protein FliS [Massilia sp. WF1]